MKNDGCLICGGESEGFTVCVDCGVKVYIDRGSLSSDKNDLMEYLKEHNPKRFDMLIKKYGNSTKHQSKQE